MLLTVFNQATKVIV